MAILAQPVNINGVAFAHSDIVVNILGVPVLGVTDITTMIRKILRRTTGQDTSLYQ